MKKTISIPPWTNPLVIIAAWSVVSILSWVTPESTYMSLMKTPKYVDLTALSVSLSMLAAFAFGSIFGIFSSRSRPHKSDSLTDTISFLSSPSIIRFSLLLFCLTVFAYIIAFAPTFSVARILTIMSATTYSAKIDTSIAGITTMTQLGVAVAVHSAIVLFSRAPVTSGTRRLLRIMLWTLVVMASYRSLIWSERLALVETLVPIIVIYVAFNIRSRFVLAMMIPAGFVAAVFVFGLFEYFRSWPFYRDSFDNIIEFSFQRFMGYYYSSFNNFGMAVSHIEPSWKPIWTLDFLYRFPIPGNPLAETKAESVTLLFDEALSLYTHQEFNLYSGPGIVYVDFGLIFGSVIQFVIGFITGRIYNAFRRCSVHGLLFYPIWMVGMIDYGRIMYWSLSRAFPIWIAVMILVCIYARNCNRRRARQQTGRQPFVPTARSSATTAPDQV